MCSRTGGFLIGKWMIITGQSFLPFQSSAVCLIEINVVVVVVVVGNLF